MCSGLKGFMPISTVDNLRVHIDYAGPFMEMFLVIVDAHTKWIEVHKTTLSLSAATISLLRSTFATLGLPEVIVSDNAAKFY